MNTFRFTYYLYLLLFLMINTSSFAQNIHVKKQGNKYGVWKFSEAIIPAVYDTILPFDSTASVCMACVKSQKPGNKFIKTNTTVLMCKYLNQKNEALIVKRNNDTCVFFTYSKQAIQSYSSSKNHFIVDSKGKKHVVNKQFKQLTYNGYDDIINTSLSNYFIVNNKTIGASYLEGLIDEHETLIMPFEYSSIKINPFDTLFMGCTAQLKTNGNDDVFNSDGKKIHNFNRHIDCATRQFIIHKVFIPKEYYVILNLETNKEKNIFAEEIVYLGKETISVKIKGKPHICNLLELETYNFLNHEKH
jgi:hypothetical protein